MDRTMSRRGLIGLLAGLAAACSATGALAQGRGWGPDGMGPPGQRRHGWVPPGHRRRRHRHGPPPGRGWRRHGW